MWTQIKANYLPSKNCNHKYNYRLDLKISFKDKHYLNIFKAAVNTDVSYEWLSWIEKTYICLEENIYNFAWWKCGNNTLQWSNTLMKNYEFHEKTIYFFLLQKFECLECPRLFAMNCE